MLFVSHNMAAVQALCQSCLVIVGGRKEFYGATTEAIDRYLANDASSAVFNKPAKGTGRPELIAASVASLKTTAENQTELVLSFSIQSGRKMNVNIDVRIRDNRGAPVGLATFGATMSSNPVSLSPGTSNVAMAIDVTSLAVGTYTLSIDITTPWVEYHDRCEDCLKFSIGGEHWPGLLHPLRQEWRYGSVFFPSTQHNGIDNAIRN